ncbi:PhnE/PtxC family ABC transporter permease [Arcobacter sp. FWKO B]|uniref:PhnE/PtxC family ABC transporter permease n=1 Tax=Arcobacter sp. FWKO B TaxID=2593672 RepID=UPI0018A52D57|nr:ABC transporter permease subunit [Arcobacter sp. FWKO B]QOG11793.1 ABC transporter permease subunit [Arcobacter sp. FWKO B]
MTYINEQKRPWGHWAGIFTIIVLLIASFVAVEWDFHSLSDANQRAMAFDRMLSWLYAFSNPDLSKEFLQHSFALTLQTLSAAVLATFLSIIAAFFLAMGSAKSVCVAQSKGVFYYFWSFVCSFCRIVQDILRAVPDFVWAVILVAVIGLGPLTGALALALSMTGILAKVYSELYDSVDKKKYEQVNSLGAGKLGVFFYAIAPLSSRGVLSFTLMRAECAIRNAAVIGAVGGGGLGSDIWYNIQFGDWAKVATLILFTLALTLSADLVSNFIRKQLRNDPNHPKSNKQKSLFKELSRSYIALATAGIIVIWSVWFMGWGNNTPQGNKNHLQSVVELFTQDSWKNLSFFERLLKPDFDLAAIGIGDEESILKKEANNQTVKLFSQYSVFDLWQINAWKSWDEELNKWFVYRVIKSAGVPLAMAIVGTLLGVLMAIAISYPHSYGFMCESSQFTGEKPSLIKKTIGNIKLYLAKLTGLISRGVPEVMWAFLFISFFGPGILAGTLAIAIHSAGVLVRVFSESIDNIPYRKFEQSFSGSKITCFGLVAIPVAWKEWLTYSFFQFESNVRMAVVLGIVGAGGLGFMFSFNFEWFMFEQASTYLLMIIALTIIIDRISRRLNLSRVG